MTTIHNCVCHLYIQPATFVQLDISVGASFCMIYRITKIG